MSADDKLDIINVLNLYAFAVDTQRWSLFDQIFTPDVEANYGPDVRWSSVESFKEGFAMFHAPLRASQHVVTNHQMVLRGDSANALSYVRVRLVRSLDGNNESYWESGGWYDDVLVRTTLGWRIRTRDWKGSWSDGEPRVGETVPGSKFEPAMTSLCDEADLGTVAYLKALTNP